MSGSPVNYAVQRPVINLVVFGIEGERDGLALHTVERVLPMVAVSPLPNSPAVVLGVINLHV